MSRNPTAKSINALASNSCQLMDFFFLLENLVNLYGSKPEENQTRKISNIIEKLKNLRMQLRR